MNRILPLLSIASLLFVSSCSTDFQLEGEWKDIPVVYAFLNSQDTAHYIRVEKAFLEPGGNALEIARIADSLYYDNIVVQIEKVNTGQVFTLERVDGNLEGYPRQDGIFAEAPNYLYKIRQAVIDLEGGEPLRFKLDRGADGDMVTAETTVLSNLVPVEASPPSEIGLPTYERLLNIAWEAGDEARLFDVRFLVKYRESDPNTPGGFLDKQIEWVISPLLVRDENINSNRVQISVRWEDFFRNLAAQIDGSDNLIRIFAGMDLIVTGAGKELEDFLTVSNANIGITSSQAIPSYSNLSEGLGVFTSRTVMRRSSIKLRSVPCDSLMNGIYTQGLGFAGCQ